MDFEKIYKQFNEAFILQASEFGFEIKINNEWRLLYIDSNGKYNYYNKGEILTVLSKKEAIDMLKNLQNKFHGSEIRIVKGHKNGYKPI